MRQLHKLFRSQDIYRYNKQLEMNKNTKLISQFQELKQNIHYFKTKLTVNKFGIYI